MSVTEVTGALVVGLIIGVVGPPALPGAQHLPTWLTILMGIAASLLGALIAARFDRADTDGLH